MVCPICKKAELEEKALVCPECKSSTPYALLEGFSPVKKLSDELDKSEGRKKRNVILTVALAAVIVFLIGSVVYALKIKSSKTVVVQDTETVAELEKYKGENAEISAKVEKLEKYKDDNAKLLAEIQELKASGGKATAPAGDEGDKVSSAELEKSQAENEELLAKIEALEKGGSKASDLSSENVKLKSQITKLKDKSSKLTAELSEYKGKGSQKSSEISKLNKKIKSLKKQLKEKGTLLAQAQTQAKTQTTGGPTVHIVKPGESLYTISKKYYGTGFKYKKIAADNNISDPDRICVGKKLTIYK